MTIIKLNAAFNSNVKWAFRGVSIYRITDRSFETHTITISRAWYWRLWFKVFRLFYPPLIYVLQHKAWIHQAHPAEKSYPGRCLNPLSRWLVRRNRCL